MLLATLNCQWHIQRKCSPGPQHLVSFQNFEIFNIALISHQIWKDHLRLSQNIFWRWWHQRWRHSDTFCTQWICLTPMVFQSICSLYIWSRYDSNNYNVQHQNNFDFHNHFSHRHCHHWYYQSDQNICHFRQIRNLRLLFVLYNILAYFGDNNLNKY